MNIMSDDIEEKMQLVHKKLLEIAKNENNSIEVAMMFGSDMSDIGIKPISDISNVDLNVPGRTKAVYVLHNHPNNASFSDKDFSWLMRNDNVKYFSIVKNNGNVEIIHIPDEFDKRVFETEYKRLVKKYEKDIAKDVQDGYNKVVEKLLTKSKCGIECMRGCLCLIRKKTLKNLKKNGKKFLKKMGFQMKKQ